MNCDPPGSSVHAILQARVLEWVAISFSKRVGEVLLITSFSKVSGFQSLTHNLYVFSICHILIYEKDSDKDLAPSHIKLYVRANRIQYELILRKASYSY